MRKAAGILMIISGFIGGSLWIAIVRDVASHYAQSIGSLSGEEAARVAVHLGIGSGLTNNASWDWCYLYIQEETLEVGICWCYLFAHLPHSRDTSTHIADKE